MKINYEDYQRIVFSGTRRRAPPFIIAEILGRYYHEQNVLIIEGGAPGVDRQIQDLGKVWGMNVITAWAPWNSKGPSAGPFRNQLMLDIFKPHKVYLLPDKESKGTIDMYKRVKEQKFNYEILQVDAR